MRRALHRKLHQYLDHCFSLLHPEHTNRYTYHKLAYHHNDFYGYYLSDLFRGISEIS